MLFSEIFLSESGAELAASPGALRQRGSITIDTKDANYFFSWHKEDFCCQENDL